MTSSPPATRAGSAANPLSGNGNAVTDAAAPGNARRAGAGAALPAVGDPAIGPAAPAAAARRH